MQPTVLKLPTCVHGCILVYLVQIRTVRGTLALTRPLASWHVGHGLLFAAQQLLITVL